MTERFTVYPPEIVEAEGGLIFIAGPIQGAPDWQVKAAETIHGVDSEIVVASPRKDYEPGTFEYERQVDWETAFLRKAGMKGVVLFWLAKQTIPTPGRDYAQTSRFELAEWMMRHVYEGSKLTIGIEEGFGNERYIRRRFGQEVPDVKIANSLFETCMNAVELLAASE
jgi:hypothetical protein